MSFLTIKSVRQNALILLGIESKTVIEEQTLVHKFNSYYTNIVQNTSGKIPWILGTINPSLTDSEMIKPITDSYKIHPSIKLIEENLSPKGSFHFANVSVRGAKKNSKYKP